MKFKHPKWLIALYCFVGTITVGLSIAVFVYVSENLYHNPNKLSKREVANNITKKKGKWFGKKSLTASDLSEYKTIANDAFDIDNISLDSIEIPKSMMLSYSNQSITWSSVKEIKIEKHDPIDEASNWFIINDVLYYRYYSTFGLYNYLTATSIADRQKHINKLEVCNLISNPNFTKDNCTLIISSYFYDKDVFKNVDVINVVNDAKGPCLSIIGSNAFYGCEKLQSASLYNDNGFKDYIIISSSAFMNSSLQNLNIVSKNLISMFGEKSFYNCYQLSNVVIDTAKIEVNNYAFASDNSNPIDARKISMRTTYDDPQSIKSTLYNYVFAGKYNSLQLEFRIFEMLWITDNNTFKEIDVTDPTKFKISSNVGFNIFEQNGLDVKKYNEVTNYQDIPYEGARHE